MGRLDSWLLAPSTSTAKKCRTIVTGGRKPACAHLYQDGSVAIEGPSHLIIDFCRVQNRLFDVRQIAATSSAFAALRGDGAVETWGNPNQGGDSTAVQSQLQEVKSLAATDVAFAALRHDGTVVTWGDPYDGGDSRMVRNELKEVEQIAACSCAFAALLGSGRIVTWGDHFDDEGPIRELRHVREIRGLQAHAAFAALLRDGTVVTWQEPELRPSAATQRLLRGVVKLESSGHGFVALRSDGVKVSWGDNLEDVHRPDRRRAASRRHRTRCA